MNPISSQLSSSNHMESLTTTDHAGLSSVTQRSSDSQAGGLFPTEFDLKTGSIEEAVKAFSQKNPLPKGSILESMGQHRGPQLKEIKPKPVTGWRLY